jgi:hypothetical protein
MKDLLSRAWKAAAVKALAKVHEPDDIRGQIGHPV